MATSVASARVGPRRGDHRVEHLRGGDRRPRELAGDPQQPLLDDRHLLDRQLDPEVAARDHHAVGGADDLLGASTACGFSILAISGSRVCSRTVLDVLGRAHERQRDQVDADRLAEAQHVEVLLGHRLQAAGRAGDVQALARGDRAADLDRRLDLAVADADAARPAAGSRRRPGRSRRRGRPPRPARAQLTDIRRSSPSSVEPHISTSRSPGLSSTMSSRARRSAASARAGPGGSRPGGRRGSAAARTRSAFSACSSRLPCEKFSRATSIPASTIRTSVSGSRDAGPMVATILVRRIIGAS